MVDVEKNDFGHQEAVLPRQDDFENAFKLAAEEIKTRVPEEVSRLAMAEYDPDYPGFKLEFIGRPYGVLMPEAKGYNLDTGDEAPIQEQGLILHYLNKADGAAQTDNLVGYRETPSGEFYYGAFVKRAEAPLMSFFGRQVEKFVQAGQTMGAKLVDGLGDKALRIQALPRTPITLVVWEGDDEFEPTAKILFDSSISHYLDTEDVAVLSGMVVYRLMKLAS